MYTEEIIEKLKPLFKAIYKKQNGGCCLHVAIDDGNWESIGDPDDKDDFNPRHKNCREAARLLLQIPLEERERLTHDGGNDLRLQPDENDECPHCGRIGPC